MELLVKRLGYFVPRDTLFLEAENGDYTCFTINELYSDAVNGVIYGSVPELTSSSLRNFTNSIGFELEEVIIKEHPYYTNLVSGELNSSKGIKVKDLDPSSAILLALAQNKPLMFKKELRINDNESPWVMDKDLALENIQASIKHPSISKLTEKIASTSKEFDNPSIDKNTYKELLPYPLKMRDRNSIGEYIYYIFRDDENNTINVSTGRHTKASDEMNKEFYKGIESLTRKVKVNYEIEKNRGVYSSLPEFLTRLMEKYDTNLIETYLDVVNMKFMKFPISAILRFEVGTEEHNILFPGELGFALYNQVEKEARGKIFAKEVALFKEEAPVSDTSPSLIYN